MYAQVFIILYVVAFSHAAYLLIDDKGVLALNAATGNITRLLDMEFRHGCGSLTIDDKNKRLFYTVGFTMARTQWNQIAGISLTTNETMATSLIDRQLQSYYGLIYDNEHSNLLAFVYERDNLNVRLVTQNGTELNLSPVVSTLNYTGYLEFIGVNKEKSTIVILLYDAEKNSQLVQFDIGSGAVVSKVKTSHKNGDLDKYFLNSAKDVVYVVTQDNYDNATYSLLDIQLKTGVVGKPYKIFDSSAHKDLATQNGRVAYNPVANEILLAMSVNEKETYFVVTDVTARAEKSMTKASLVPIITMAHISDQINK
jgi:hypothetical protein